MKGGFSPLVLESALHLHRWVFQRPKSTQQCKVLKRLQIYQTPDIRWLYGRNMKQLDGPVRWWGETLGESRPHSSSAGPCWLRSAPGSWCSRPLSNRGPSPDAPSACSPDLSAPPWWRDDRLREAHWSPSPCDVSRGQPWIKKASGMFTVFCSVIVEQPTCTL